MAKKEVEPKIILEREYIVPLRKSWLKTPKYKRTPKAIKALKSFIARHMKVEDRDLKKVKIDKWLNNEMWFRGIQHPYHKIKVKASKLDNGIVNVSLVDIPKVLQYKIDKENKLKEEAEKVKEKKKAEEAKEKAEQVKEAEESKEEKKETEEKEKSSVEAGLKQAGKEAKQIKHIGKQAKAQPKHQVRKALKK